MIARTAQSTTSALSARHELAAAEHIERLQVEVWCLLLSYRPALPLICAELEPFIVLPEELTELAGSCRERHSAFAEQETFVRLATRIRELDSSRGALTHVEQSVQRVFAQDALAAGYLCQLRGALLAEREAKHQVVIANMGLVRALARRYARSTAPIAELIQEGNIALLRAVELFDYRRGLRFSTYAVWWIRNAFQRCISEQASAVRASLGAQRSAGQTNRFIWAHYGRTGRMPSHEEVSEHLGGAMSTMERLVSGGDTRTISLDRGADSDQDGTLLGHLVDPAPSVEMLVNDVIMHERLEQGLANLPVLEAKILRRKFGLSDGLETPLSVIAQDYKLSYERVLQLSRQGLRRLRADFEHAGIGSIN